MTSEAGAGIRVFEADLDRAEHQSAIIKLTDAYSRDPMGNGRPLPEEVRENLIPGLRRLPTAHVLLAFSDDRPIGSAVCFLGFSTFAARPLLNIHDFIVLPEARNRGTGRLLLEAVETKARQLGCCKLTLEVLENNERALRLYRIFGFARYTLQEEAGGAVFLAKPLI